MASIWKQNKDVTQQVKRNNHDLSFDNHCTMKLGYLYPVFKKFVVPGDSFRIRSAFDLKLMPLVFPLQSRMRAHLHFFYVRCKNVWPEIEDYLTGIPRNTPIVEPYLKPDDSKVSTGSIYDFLGVPTTVVTKSGVSDEYFPIRGASTESKTIDYFVGRGSASEGHPLALYPSGTNGTPALFLQPADNSFFADDEKLDKFFIKEGFFDFIDDKFNLDTSSSLFSWFIIAISKSDASFKILLQYDEGVLSNITHVDSSSVDNYIYILTPSSNSGLSLSSKVTFNWKEDFKNLVGWQINIPSGFQEYKDLGLDLYSNVLHLKAMPFRAYESIYRAYYANDILQPLIDSNGDAQYNKFCTTTASGQDTTDYHLFKRNYELDFLTSAYPSPQAGPAPLVGISALGNITIEDENGITTAKAVVDESTGQITGVSITSPLASVEHGRTLVNISQAGISINDFRNANALQRFLEQTLRSGYRYIDFIRGQWGVKPKDQALDMPEFIGGFSRDVALQTVTSVADMASSSDDPLSKQLGGFAGVGRVLGGSEHAISKFCDDYGYIIGVMSVTPTPAYSQLLDKQMIAGDNYLSFPFASFNQLGMQPIPYKEVTPIQAYLDSLEDSSKSINDTFGYQRPNYDLVGSVDEVHGEFRSTLRNFLINRIFDGRPELGSSFIEIDPSEVNDVFVNQSPDDDVLIGHIRFKVDTKRPFPRIHFPSL